MRVFTLLSALLLAAGPAAAEVELLYIVDSSAAMEAPLGGMTRAEAVASVLPDEIEALPAGAKAGLALFGHRSTIDCRDAQVVVAPGGVERGVMKEELATLMPIGKSITARGLDTGVRALHRQTAHTVVVLVGGGGDECGGNVCATVQALKHEGLRFDLHVIGLAPSPADEKELQCAAEVGGGAYVRAGGAAELRERLQTLRARLPEIAAARAPAVPANPGWLLVTLDEAALPALASVDIVRLSDGATVASITRLDTIFSQPLAAGRYRVEFAYQALGGRRGDRVPAGEVDITAGERAFARFGMLKLVLANRPALASLRAFRVVPVGAGVAMLTIDPALAMSPRPLPLGRYDIWLDYADGRPSVKLASDAAFGEMGGVIIELDPLLKNEGRR